MRIHQNQKCARWNWIAIFSFSASLAVSLAIWKGVFLAVGRLVR
jgi:hypothetical protein